MSDELCTSDAAQQSRLKFRTDIREGQSDLTLTRTLSRPPVVSVTTSASNSNWCVKTRTTPHASNPQREVASWFSPLLAEGEGLVGCSHKADSPTFIPVYVHLASSSSRHRRSCRASFDLDLNYVALLQAKLSLRRPEHSQAIVTKLSPKLTNLLLITNVSATTDTACHDCQCRSRAPTMTACAVDLFEGFNGYVVKLWHLQHPLCRLTSSAMKRPPLARLLGLLPGAEPHMWRPVPLCTDDARPGSPGRKNC